MTMDRTRAAAASFESRDQAERAVDRLHQAGFEVDRVGWAMRGDNGERPEGTTDAAAGVGTGAVVGGAVGAAAAAATMADHDRARPRMLLRCCAAGQRQRRPARH